MARAIRASASSALIVHSENASRMAQTSIRMPAPFLANYRRHCQTGVLFGFRQGLDDLRCLAQSLHVTLPTQKVTHSRRFVLLTFCGVKTPVVRRKITGLVAGLPPHANAWTEGCLTHHGVCCRRPINLPMLFSGPCP